MGGGSSTLVLVLLVWMVIAAAPSGAISQDLVCDDVIADLKDCIQYLFTIGRNPTRDCCRGVLRLKNRATSTKERQRVCSCLKQASARHPSYKFNQAKQLPQKCNVNIGYSITTPKVDCSKIR